MSTAAIGLTTQPNTEVVRWSDGALVSDAGHVSYDLFGSWWTPAVYPVNTYSWSYSSPQPNATELAFKVAAKLMERGTVGEMTVKDFVALVTDIAAVIGGRE